MKALVSLLAVGLLATPAFAAPKSFKDVSVVDVNCSSKVVDNVDAHTRSCALKCKDSGFGIVTADKQFLKFDAAGNAKIAKQLQKSKETDHLRVNVKGDVDGDTLKVESIKLL